MMKLNLLSLCNLQHICQNDKLGDDINLVPDLGYNLPFESHPNEVPETPISFDQPLPFWTQGTYVST